MKTTFLEELLRALKEAATYNKDDLVPPEAILWPDEKRDWENIVPKLREKLPILTLGKYNPKQLTGPAIWIRCFVAKKIPEANWAEDVTPIIYLPGYARADLRALEECPEPIKPLAELQYRGNVWNQRNGRDWTLNAFLHSKFSLDIPVAGDSETQAALKRAAVLLLHEPITLLKENAPLRADFFDSIVTPDLSKQVLLWMNEPELERKKLTSSHWEAFCSQCKKELALDPVADGPITAAQKMGEQVGQWPKVWQRFKEAPNRYPQIPDLLRQAKQPKNPDLFSNENIVEEFWPQDNEFGEKQLRSQLTQVTKLSKEEARERIFQLEEDHAQRRSWIWAELGQSGFAQALEHLVQIVELSAIPIKGNTVEELADHYFQEGWKVDAAALNALACMEDQQLLPPLCAVFEVFYLPWLQQFCEHFQTAWEEKKPFLKKVTQEPTAGTVYLFVDGLRLDLGYTLIEKFSQIGLTSQVDYRLAPLPSITESAKPAATPIGGLFYGGSGLSPTTKQGTEVNAAVLRKHLKENGFIILNEGKTGDPTKAAWTECGVIDQIGHIEGWQLSKRAHEELIKITKRVQELLAAGWSEIKVVTDHGWLLLPDNLPKHYLPEIATEIRKGRAARLKPGAKVDCTTIPWFWDPNVSIAVPPGIKCFISGREYEHGGISPQELVVPELTIQGKPQTVKIDCVKWIGMRCRVSLIGANEDLAVDLRLKPADPNSSLAQAEVPVGDDGNVSLLCKDYDLEDTAAVIVVFNLSNPTLPLDQHPTIIGGN
jgi:hypothetical protein